MWIWAPSRADAASCSGCHRHDHGLLSQWQKLYARTNSQDLDIAPALCVQAQCSKAMRCRMCECSSAGEWEPFVAWMSTLLVGTALGAVEVCERRLQSWEGASRPCQ